MKTIEYTPELRIRNTQALPRGLNCKFMLCMISHTGELVAHSWKRKFPKEVKPGYVVVVFKN